MSLLSMAGMVNVVENSGKFRYWRVLTTQDAYTFNGLQHFQIAELQFNSVQASGGIPLSSSSSESPPQFTLNNAFDGILLTENVWSSDTGFSGEYIGYEFPHPIRVDSCAISARDHPNIASLWTPHKFKIQYSSDGLVWKDSWAVDTSPFYRGETRVFINPNY